MPSITIELTDEAYQLAQTAAAYQEQPVDGWAASTVSEQAYAAERERRETIAAIEQGLADMEAGRHYSLEEVQSFLERRREARRRAIEEVPHP